MLNNGRTWFRFSILNMAMLETGSGLGSAQWCMLLLMNRMNAQFELWLFGTCRIANDRYKAQSESSWGRKWIFKSETLTGFKWGSLGSQ